MIKPIRTLPLALQQTLLYGLSIALMKGISLLMLPFITHYLDPTTFGRLEVLASLGMIGSVLIGMGLEDTLYRYAGSAQSQRERRRHAAEIFGLTLLIGTITLIAGWLIAPSLAQLLPGNPATIEVRWVLVVLALEGAIAVPLGWLRMQERHWAFFSATVGRTVLQALLVVVLLSQGGGVEEILFAGVVAALLQALYLGTLQLRESGIHFYHNRYRQLLRYSLPIVGSGVVAFALNGMDRWVLAQQTNLHTVAEYGVAAKFALAAVLLLQPFGMWWSPRRFQVLKQSNGPQQVCHYATLGMTLALIITAVVGLIAPLLIQQILPAAYSSAAHYVVWLVLAMAFKECGELVNIGCFNGESTHSQLLINLLAASIGILLMFPLSAHYGAEGMVATLVVAQGVRLLLPYRVSQYYLPLPYPLLKLTGLLMLVVVWLSISQWNGGGWSQLGLSLLALGSLLLYAAALSLIPTPSREPLYRRGQPCQ